MDAMIPYPPEWMAKAACTVLTSELFFPDKGGTDTGAKKICATCPVREECLMYALATGQKQGVWGGLSPLERGRMRRSRYVA